MHSLSDLFSFFSYSTTNRVEIASEKNHTLPEKYGPFFHDQPIDHFSSNSSTFKHRYWANADHYQQGGPVVRKSMIRLSFGEKYLTFNCVVYNAGETPADDRSFYVINSTMADLARRLNGIVVVMEHRFYGKSMPAPVKNHVIFKVLQLITYIVFLQRIFLLNL